jgi:predicted histone-like DNA-binding protein
MGVSITVQKRVLKFTENEKTVYVAKAQRGDVIMPDKIAKYLAKDTGAPQAEVKMILDTLVESMMDWIEEGHGVKLGNFGSFMPTAKSASSEDPEEVGVKRMWVTFYASKQLKNRLDEVKYSTENEFAVETEKEDSGSSSGGNSSGSGTGNNPL